MTPRVVVLGMGAATSVGLTAAETAASVRAGVCRFAGTPFLDRYGEPLIMGALSENLLPAPDPILSAFPGISERQRRLVRLAGLALTDVRAALPSDVRVPLLLALPEHTTADEVKDNRDLLHLIAEQARLRLDLAASAIFPSGRGGGIVALRAAAEWLATERWPCVIVGGVDTYWDRDLLQSLDRQGRVSSRVNTDAPIPGEGAGFLLITSARGARNSPTPALGCIDAIQTGFETGHLHSAEPYRGEGLAGAFAGLFATAPHAEPVGAVYAGFTGESYPAKSWGVAFLRHTARFAEDHGFQHPADCIGDTGAAMAPIMVILSILGMRGGYRRGPCLVWCLSDWGECGAAMTSVSNEAASTAPSSGVLT